MRIRPKSALDSVPAAQSLRLGLRRPTSLYTREARGKGSKSAQNVKILLSLRGAPATWQSVFSLYRCGIYVRRQEDADCHDRCAHRSRDGGIPRFINLPPSPFRGNDRGIRTGKPICHAVQGAMVSGRHRGRPLRVGFGYLLSFLPCSSLYSGDPFGTSCHCLAAARSRRGSDMPPACHSLPRRRFAT